MKHLVDTIKLVDDAMYLVDQMQDTEIKVSFTATGDDLVIADQAGSYVVVDAKLFVGSLRAMNAKRERDEFTARGRK